jgi:hypothetical protein
MVIRNSDQRKNCQLYFCLAARQAETTQSSINHIPVLDLLFRSGLGHHPLDFALLECE